MFGVRVDVHVERWRNGEVNWTAQKIKQPVLLTRADGNWTPGTNHLSF